MKRHLWLFYDRLPTTDPLAASVFFCKVDQKDTTRRHLHGRIPIAQIKEIVPGKQSTALQSKLAANTHADRCFSLVGTEQRIDIEIESVGHAQSWITGLRALVDSKAPPIALLSVDAVASPSPTVAKDQKSATSRYEKLNTPCQVASLKQQKRAHYQDIDVHSPIAVRNLDTGAERVLADLNVLNSVSSLTTFQTPLLPASPDNCIPTHLSPEEKNMLEKMEQQMRQLNSSSDLTTFTSAATHVVIANVTAPTTTTQNGTSVPDRHSHNIQSASTAFPRSNPSTWDEQQVAFWLGGRGLGQHVRIFQKRRITGRDLLLMRDHTCVSLGITGRSDRKKLLTEITKLKKSNK